MVSVFALVDRHTMQFFLTRVSLLIRRFAIVSTCKAQVSQCSLSATVPHQLSGTYWVEDSEFRNTGRAWDGQYRITLGLAEQCRKLAHQSPAVVPG